MYWEPHTSSIDFCESNYMHYPGIVEFHNTWSSFFGICWLGWIGMMYNNPTKETRFTVAYAIIILVGLGSTGLHGSLHWIFQSSDELPMILFSNVLNYIFLEYDSPIGKPHYPMLPYAVGALCVFNTIFYYRFQHMFAIFFCTYASGVAMHVFMGYKIVVKGRDRRGHDAIALHKAAFGTYFGGLFVWILDMHYCDAILQVTDSLPESFGLLRGITPHVIWHFAAAFGTYFTVACVTACRMEELKMPYRLEYFGGIVPIVALASDQKPKNV